MFVALASAAGTARAQNVYVLDAVPLSSFAIGTRSADSGLSFNNAFLTEQLRHPRVREARFHTRLGIKQMYRDRGIEYPAAEVFIRVFKRERLLELWVRHASAQEFSLLKSYPVCALAGELGPKRMQGDNQTPEGFYRIDAFNPNSRFHLSLHVDYPNRSDQQLGRRTSLGGDIFIHGGCQTEGCIAVTDDAIKEIYWIGVEARAAGQRNIPIHIFPARLTDDEIGRLRTAFDNQPELQRFWSNLKPGFDFFENSRTLPAMTVGGNGLYGLAGAASDITDSDLGASGASGMDSAPAAAATGRGAETGPRVLGAPSAPDAVQADPANRPTSPGDTTRVDRSSRAPAPLPSIIRATGRTSFGPSNVLGAVNIKE